MALENVENLVQRALKEKILLKRPKLMKDLYTRVTIKSGRSRMSLSTMNCPVGVVCPVRTSEEYELPKDPSWSMSSIVPIMKLTPRTKMFVEHSIALLEEHCTDCGWMNHCTSTKIRIKMTHI
ncbi:hypothetical protein BDA99DRAFT_535462 [Phascolomyces articulosus]|uniref:Uncharacterized protein n=1 Tax=Phascolomyces articulosus TaxID=60185 RepID=A0AAD5PF85_9FUNG|nr:hypothetical protein BDA99DRAFT_535462 [Phascolomyces articulosus]